MKKVFLASVTVVVFFAASCNNDRKITTGAEADSSITSAPVDDANAPVINFEKTSYDFGTITEGEKASYDFKFTNTGKTPLIISNATATCGCTIPDYPHEPIAPGKSSVIKVVFDSEGKQGMQNKVVTITSNSIEATTEVYMVGEVKSKK